MRNGGVAANAVVDVVSENRGTTSLEFVLKWVDTKTPEQIGLALEAFVPKKSGV
jgi:hypothetical protein